jgi:hypothetical protein
MQRPGADPDNMQMTDFLCDFCRREWTEDVPMVEGHQGSLICGKCLTIAYLDVDPGVRSASLPAGATCTMCLEEREEAMWQSPMHPQAFICRRCVKQAAGALSKDKESGWKRPE